jgi:hypothetical protein
MLDDLVYQNDGGKLALNLSEDIKNLFPKVMSTLIFNQFPKQVDGSTADTRKTMS